MLTPFTRQPNMPRLPTQTSNAIYRRDAISYGQTRALRAPSQLAYKPHFFIFTTAGCVAP